MKLEYKKVKIDRSIYDMLEQILMYHEGMESSNANDFINKIIYDKIRDIGDQYKAIVEGAV